MGLVAWLRDDCDSLRFDYKQSQKKQIFYADIRYGWPLHNGLELEKFQTVFDHPPPSHFVRNKEGTPCFANELSRHLKLKRRNFKDVYSFPFCQYTGLLHKFEW